MRDRSMAPSLCAPIGCSCHRWKGIAVITILLVHTLALHGGIGNNDLIECTHLPPRRAIPKEITAEDGNRSGNQLQKNPDNTNDNIPSNITFIGISLNSDSVSDSATRFLIEAACVHNIKSYILLGEGSNKPLRQKILAMAYHWHLPLENADGNTDLKCINWIRVRTAPSEDMLINMTRSYVESASVELNWSNNPLDTNSRIAKIKRSREYQRQQLLQNMISWGGYIWDWKYHTVIGVLDLDLFAYPPNISDVVETAARYIIPSGSARDDKRGKFHAVCANGLQVSGGRRSYYDIFSTILLPNTWLHRESDRLTERGKLEGENFDLAKMSQTKMLQWLLKEGNHTSNHPGVDRDNDIMEVRSNNQQQYHIVPVRSCFNGFTLYRADVFFDSHCRYDMYDKNDDLYASRSERHTCEHIVFNECLRRTLAKGDEENKFRIGVKPDLLTLWHLLQ